MTATPQTSEKPVGFPLRIVRRFLRDDNGAMTFFGIFMFLTMTLFGGVGIDIMMAEVKRTKMQTVLDSAILAAAKINTTRDAQTIVEDYFEKAGLLDYLVDVQVDIGSNYKRVTAEAERVVPANFLRLFSVEGEKITGLRVKASGSAEERVAKVEISLVLDISGSMETNNKIQDVRDAANIFVDTVLNDFSEDLVSINLIPYSEHVNVGPPIYNQLNTNTLHNYSHCVDMSDTEMTTVALDTAATYDQVPHYQFNWDGNFANNAVEDTVCPQYDYERIQAMSQNHSALENQINALQPRAGTSIFLGVKWGASLLDPSTRGIVSNLVTSGDVDAVFDGRPLDYTDPDVIKNIVVMTDGQNDWSTRPDPDYYLNPTVFGTAIDIDGNGTDDVTEGLDFWANNNFQRDMWMRLSPMERSSAYYQHYTAGSGNSLQNSICNAAKAQGIIIWTIAFETPSAAANRMRNCASSPSHYFEVDQATIVDTFEQIARSINQLQLVM